MSDDKEIRWTDLMHMLATMRWAAEREPMQPAQLTREQLATRYTFWKASTLTTQFLNHFFFVAYSAALLGCLSVPFWLWIVWAMFVSVTLLGYVSHLCFQATCNALVEHDSREEKAEQIEISTVSGSNSNAEPR